MLNNRAKEPRTHKIGRLNKLASIARKKAWNRVRKDWKSPLIGWFMRKEHNFKQKELDETYTHRKSCKDCREIP